jgi:hypothetical protein
VRKRYSIFRYFIQILRDAVFRPCGETLGYRSSVVVPETGPEARAEPDERSA